MRSELIVRGGLGNQLFIVLEAYRILLSLGHSVALNLTEYMTDKRPDRTFVAGNLFPQILTDFQVPVDVLARLRYHLAKLGAKYANRNVSDLRLPGDTSFAYTTPSGTGVRIGYYQYLGSTEMDEAALMRVKEMFSRFILNAYSNRLAVHVRRGDYLLAKHSMHGLVKVSDLRAEIGRALQESNFDGITVFTDSPELLDISEFGSFDIDVTIDHGGKSTDVLTRMASHAGIIASNSSFSLWAGLLGRPRYFSLPQFWMPSIDSSRLGARWVRRYPCIL